jgi:hypothetical protein
MRYSFVLVLLSLTACTGDSEQDFDGGLAFEITSTSITLQPGEETTKCFYFTTPNAAPVQINKWISDMTPGSHHMIMFRTLGGTQPPDGTVDEACGGGLAVPVYGTQIAHDEKAFPTDDGMGKPLAQEVPAASQGYFQMHYLNTSDEVLTASVTLKAYSLKAGLEFTKTDLFATYNNDISIPPGATNYKVSATCDVVLRNFWSLSSHSHKQSIATEVKEGTTTVFSSTDWEHPGTIEWRAPEFKLFDSGKITWECTYNNTGDNATRTVTSGQSAQTDEMCMATGYFFPATGPKGCIMNAGQCQCLL